jgi:hypothetical protein
MSCVVVTVRRQDASADDFQVEMADGFVSTKLRFRNYFAAMDAATKLQKDLAPARLVDLVGGADGPAS